MPHFLLLPVGSHGDVHPFVGIGAVLLARGHRVTVLTAEPFRDEAVRNGLGFVPTISTDEYHAVMHHPDLWHPRKGLRVILDGRLLRKYLPAVVELIREHYRPGETVAVAGSLAFAARIAHDALGIPLATAHLQPMSCCSVADPPVSPSGADWTWLPRPLVRLAYRAAEWWVTDPLAAPAINECRAGLGLPPVGRVLTRWLPSPQRVLGLFPDWFGPIPDGGPAFRHAGFPLFDDAHARPTPPPLAEFLTAGPPPVVFSFGSAMRNGRPYFEAAVEACRRLGVRGVLLGKGGDQIPPDLPANILQADYAPFSEVFPRAAAVVHHGGIGTSAQGMRAGVPQLVMPMAYDQADNAARMRRLGAADTLFPRRFTGERLAERLGRLLDDERMRRAAKGVSERFRGADGVATAGRLVEELLGTDAKPPVG